RLRLRIRRRHDKASNQQKGRGDAGSRDAEKREGAKGRMGEWATHSDEFVRCRPFARYPDRLIAPPPHRAFSPSLFSASLLPASPLTVRRPLRPSDELPPLR